jgi:hypothetical protein
MLDKLTALPSTTLGKIRHIRLGGSPLMLCFPYNEYDAHYRPVAVLKLLPGLRLDTLTILGPPSPEVSYDTINGLITEGMGNSDTSATAPKCWATPRSHLSCLTRLTVTCVIPSLPIGSKFWSLGTVLLPIRPSWYIGQHKPTTLVRFSTEICADSLNRS